MSKETKKSEETGRVTGGMWMGRVIKATKDLAYSVGYGTGAAVAGGQNAIEGLMYAIQSLAEGAVSRAQQIGSAVARGAGVNVQALKGLDQKPYADNDAPSLAGMLASAFKAGAADGKKKVKSLQSSKDQKAAGTA